MKLVAALKLLPSPEQAACLTATLARCNEACSWLAETGFNAQAYRQFDLHKLAYTETRSRFGLTAQAVWKSPLLSGRGSVTGACSRRLVRVRPLRD